MEDWLSWLERSPDYYLSKNKMNTKQLGNIGELEVATEFLKLGCKVYFPYGDNSSVDMIIEKNHKLYKIQVKSSELKENGSISFRLRSSMVNYEKRYTKDEVDYFALYNSSLEECYIIPFTERTEIAIRCLSSKNNQIKGITYSKDVLLKNFNFN